MDPRAAPTGSTPATVDSPVTVLCVDDDPEYLDLLEAVLADETEFDVRTATSPLTVPDRLDGVDCLVTDYEMPDRDGLELLEAVRERRPTLPVVVCTGSVLSEVSEGVVGRPWTEVVRKNGTDLTTSLLVHRIRGLVDHHRTAALSRRAVAALDETTNGLAVVAADDRFAVVNRAFARAFGRDRADLVGREWRTYFPDDEVERLRSTALEPVRDDWRWTGSCVGCLADGGTFTTGTRIVGLDDGSFVIALSDTDSAADA